MNITSFANRTGHRSHKEEIELQYAFDFTQDETVVYTGPVPFPGPVFVLHFFRHAQDGIMNLLGYKKDGEWRDPTKCLPFSHVTYHRRQRPLKHTPHTQPGDATGQEDAPGHEQAQDTIEDYRQLDSGFEQMAYRVPLLKLDHGVWELPTLRGKPAHMIDYAVKSPHKAKPRISKTTPLPAVGKPIERTIEFVRMSTHFEPLSMADQELAKVIKVLKQFPQLQVTIQGNYQVQAWEKFLTRIPKTDSFLRTRQDRPFYKPYVTKWPHEVESYNSHGQIMDSRARTIQQYIINHGINARRVHTARGQYATRKTFTIIFSN